MKPAITSTISAFLILAGACASSGKQSLVVHIADVDGATPSEYVTVAAWEDDTVELLVCPAGEPTARLSCRDSGIRVVPGDIDVDVTVRARGYAFSTVSIQMDELHWADGVARVDMVLAGLESFTCNDDYCTGFAPDGSDDFNSLAYETTSEQGRLSAVKFYLRHIDTAPEVYFINTTKHQLHYTFVRDVLGFSGYRIDYDMETYFADDRTAMAGTLVYYPDVTAPSSAFGGDVTAPMALTFFPSDSLTPEHAAIALRLLEERTGLVSLHGADARMAYVPAGTAHEEDLADHTSLFTNAGALWLTTQELHGSSRIQIMNDGEAYGTLRRMTPEELASAVVSFKDILVLTRLPVELPLVGGTITEELQTPLAHVNVAAMARGTPNVAYLDAGTDPDITALLDHLVHFVAANGAFSIEAATMEEATAFWEGREQPPVPLESDLLFDELAGFNELGFDDSIRVGAKAANVAELWSILPDAVPQGFAVPFYYYHQFMNATVVTGALCALARTDCVEEGRDAALCDGAQVVCGACADAAETLGDCARRLTEDSAFSSDTLLREAMLDGLQHHIRTAEVDAAFAALLNGRVTELFGTDVVRLRSSTNAEDLAAFSGAGLYESVSANGPEPGETPAEEIRKVWASMWSFRAFEEREFWGVDHHSVYMGVLVHRAFPDEQANGVLVTRNLADPLTDGIYVNVQKGEESVTNPLAGITPEIFTIIPGPEWGSVQVARIAYSSLQPDSPLLTDAEIALLKTLRQP